MKVKALPETNIELVLNSLTVSSVNDEMWHHTSLHTAVTWYDDKDSKYQKFYLLIEHISLHENETAVDVDRFLHHYILYVVYEPPNI
jgi:hypothetical protein